MKYLLITLLFISSFAAAQTNTSATYTVIIKPDANVLPSTIPAKDTAVVFTYRVYGVNQQYIYYWHMGQPTGDSTASYMAQHYIIVPTGQTRGYWTTVNTPVGADMVIGLSKAINAQIASQGLKALLVAGALNYDPNTGTLTSLSYSKAQTDSIAALKLNKRTAITPGTQPLITYGADGLVLGGTGLTSANVVGALGYTPEQPITFSTPLSRTGNTVSISETDPLYTANGVPKTRTVNGLPLSANVTLNTDNVAEGTTNQYFTSARSRAALNAGYGWLYSTTTGVGTIDTASNTGIVSKPRLAAALAGYVRGVTLSTGSASFTSSSLLAGSTTVVTVTLSTPFTDSNYQIGSPLIFGSGGVSLLGGTFTLVSVVKNPTTVVVTLKNNALLSLAVSGTVDIVALKVSN